MKAKYEPDEIYVPLVREHAGKIETKHMAELLGISVAKLRRIAMNNRISLRVYGRKSVQPTRLPDLQDRVKPDPFGKPPQKTEE